jgi:hypothetical protein
MTRTNPPQRVGELLNGEIVWTVLDKGRKKRIMNVSNARGLSPLNNSAISSGFELFVSFV